MQRRTKQDPERKEEQVLDSTGKQYTVEQSILAPVPAAQAREGSQGPQRMDCSHSGAHASVWVWGPSK